MQRSGWAGVSPGGLLWGTAFLHGLVGVRVSEPEGGSGTKACGLDRRVDNHITIFVAPLPTATGVGARTSVLGRGSCGRCRTVSDADAQFCLLANSVRDARRM